MILIVFLEGHIAPIAHCLLAISCLSQHLWQAAKMMQDCCTTLLSLLACSFPGSMPKVGYQGHALQTCILCATWLAVPQTALAVTEQCSINRKFMQTMR